MHKELERPPMTINKNIKINSPLAGSVAKAWTDVSTPERTKKVPNKLNENHLYKVISHFLKIPLFSLTLSE